MRLLGSLLLLLAACADPAGADGGGGTDVALSADAVVLPASEAATLLRQCSRGVPAAGERGWEPGADAIVRLESSLPAALAAERPREEWSSFPQRWRRQYVGIERGGRRFVYGNFYPRSADDYASDAGRWRREPVIVCDGGPAFFGVEYDVEADRITHLDFNGMI